MFTKNELNDYEEDFIALGITDQNTMLGILNTLDDIAEITYYIEKQDNYDFFCVSSNLMTFF